jgi:3'-phosphoadenosine 5'-phosphosulfate sulfotransferase (PAPS reductase)/FAD synthetase
MLTSSERRKPNWDYLRKQKVVVSLSGGMDSTAVLLLAIQNGLQPTAVSTFGDTDHPEAAEYHGELCDRLRVPTIDIPISESYKYFVKVIKSSQDYLTAFRTFYRRQYHIPLRRVMEENNFTVRLVGYRADENQWHMGLRTHAPIFDWSKYQVRTFLQKNGIPLHPCYSQTEFLKEPIRESSWIDVQNYGLFHFADKGEINDDAIITLKWLRKYYSGLFNLVAESFDLKELGYESALDRSSGIAAGQRKKRIA